MEFTTPFGLVAGLVILVIGANTLGLLAISSG